MPQKLARQVLVGCIFIFLYCANTASTVVLLNYYERSFNPLLLAFYSFLLSTIFFNALSALKFSDLKTKVKTNKSTVIKINVATTFTWLTTFYGLHMISPAIFTGLFFGSMVISTTFLTICEDKSKKLRYAEFIFAGLICLILILLTIDDFAMTVWDRTLMIGVVLGLISGLFGAYSNILGHRLAKAGFRAQQTLSVRFIFLLIVSLAMLDKLNVSIPIHQASQYVDIVIVALTSVALPLFFLQKGLENMDAVYVSFLVPCVPILAFFLELLEPSYQFSWMELLLLMMLTATIIASVVVKNKIQEK